MPTGTPRVPCIDARGLRYPSHRYEGRDYCARCLQPISETAALMRRLRARENGKVAETRERLLRATIPGGARTFDPLAPPEHVNCRCVTVVDDD